MKRIFLYLLCLCLSFDLCAQSSTDSLQINLQSDPSTRFDAKQLIVPGVLIACGLSSINKGWLHNDNVSGPRTEHYIHLDSYLEYLPMAASLGLGLTGVKARHSLRERVALTATGYAAMTFVSQGLKHVIEEERPDATNKHSFPSGHTATAFLGAELVRSEYGWGWGTGAYVVATGVGILRLYNHKHWLNDVVAGAGIGILSARVAYWLLPAERKLFHWDKQKYQTLSVVPVYAPDSKALGAALTLTL